MRMTVDTLRARFNAGEAMDFLFFWGHTAPMGKITKACLSQWYPCDFQADGVDYHTTEQYMMAQKAQLFHDGEMYDRIMAAGGPEAYKRLGAQVRGFSQEVWDREKFGIVVRGNLAKFSCNDPLRAFLMDTGDKVLVEASPYDGIWGIGLPMRDPGVRDPNNWRGENLLGLALMEVRAQLRTGG